MATTARLDLAVWRNDDVYELPLSVRGLDLSALTLVMDIRLGRDVPGAPLARLAKVTNGNAQGLRVAGVTSDNGVPVSDLRIRLNKTTRQALPFTGELGDDTPLEYALVIDGRTRLIGGITMLAHAYDADASPTNRPPAWCASRRGGLPSSSATLTIAGNDVVNLVIEGADIALAAGERAESARDAAELAAASALASSRYFPTRAAGEAASTTGQLFSTDDGAGNVIYYRKTAGGSTEIGRALTPASLVTTLAAPGAAAGIGYGGITVARALDLYSASRSVSVLDFIPQEKWESIRAGTNTDDLTQYFQAAAAAAASPSYIEEQYIGRVHVPNGYYDVNRVGIRGTVFIGESREGTVIRAHSSGSAGDFLMDAMYDRDGTTFNTYGNGWVQNISLDGKLANGTVSGRSGLRTYGGGQIVHEVDIRNCNKGFAIGLPIWSSVTNCYAINCDTGFYTFHNSPGDNGTSATFLDCWALSCITYGFHISQLYYSSFINCVSQDAGVHNWYLEGDLNGTTACYSLQFIGCATEGSGTPFYFRRGRDITVINPRLIIPSTTANYITFDDTTGAIYDFSTVSSPGPGKYHLATTNGTPYSITLVNCLVTYAASVEGVIARMNAGAPGSTQNGVSGSSFMVGMHKVVGQQGVAISNIDVTGLTGIDRTLADTVNAILSRMRETTGHGLIAG